MRKIAILCMVTFAFCVQAQKGKHVLDSLENRITQLKNPNKILQERAVLALKYYTYGDPQKSKKVYSEALKEARLSNSQLGLGALYHTMGSLFYYQSQFDSALFYFEKALLIRKAINDTIGILKSTSNVGSIYYMLSNHKKALEYYELGLKKEAELKYDEGEYISINNLGTIYNSLKMHSEALKYFKKAEKIYSKKNRSDQLIYTYEGLANVFSYMGKPDSALVWAFKAKLIAKSLGEISSESYACLNIAVFNMELKNFTLAKKYLDTALLTAAPLKDARLEIAAFGNYAAIELRMNRPDSALPYIGKIITLQKKLNLKADRYELAEIIARYYYDKGDYKEACNYLSKFNQYKDSLYSLDIAAQISEMRTKYESEKKEKENEVLQIENDSVKTSRNYLLLILVIACITLFIAVFAYRKIKYSNILLSAQKAAIEEKNVQLEIQKGEISHQKELVDEKQKEILDSINYARRIQFALLASDGLLNQHLPEQFVLFKPKDVVSGDFYWATPVKDGFIYVTADCTGHGVPGAFMSLLNISKLSQTINENNITRPDLILNNVRTEIIKALNPKDSLEESKDGMDAIVCKVNLKKMKLEYAAANNSFYILRNNAIMVCKADKMPVGKGHDDSISFTYNEVALQKGDMIYTITDGFADQFGGTNGKKFKYKQFEEYLLAIHQQPMNLQKEKLDMAFETWKGNLEQVDDICVIGVRIT